MGSYRLVRKIACGGMAEVFLAKSVGAEGFEKPVALKRVLPHIAQDPRSVDLFLREARLTCTLQHANVVQVFDLGLSEGQPYMVLEFVDGENLRTLLKAARKREQPLPLKEALFVVQQVAEGLAHAHERCDAQGAPLHIVHRDINPANVMVSMTGEVKLADFGIAKATDFNAETQMGVVKGKAGYIAPEQVAGLAADQRGDLFLMGLLLFELLAGRPLFDGRNFFQSLLELRQFDLSRLPPLPGVPEGVVHILARALEPRPEARYQRARELADALQSFLFQERMRVGTSDIAALVARLLPERPSPLAGLHEVKGEEIRLDAPVLGGADRRAVPGPVLAAPTVKTPPRPPPLPAALQERSRPPVLAPAAAPGPLTASARTPTTPAAGASTPTPGPRESLPAEVLRDLAPPARGRGTRKRLGELLLARGKVSELRLKAALERQKRSGGKLGELLVAEGLLSEDELVRCLGEQLSQPFVTGEKLRAMPVPAKDVLGLVPLEKAERLGVVPLSVHRRELYCALSDSQDLSKLDAVMFLAGMAVKPVLAGEVGIRQAIRRFYLGEEPDASAWMDAGHLAEAVHRASENRYSDRLTLTREQSFSEEALAGAGDAAEASEGTPPSTPLPWREVLVVSDGREQREAAARLLAGRGVKATAASSTDAAALLARGVYQLVLLEGEAGGPLASTLREAAPRVAVRPLSSFAEALAGEAGPYVEAARLSARVLEGALGLLGGAAQQGAALGRLAGRVARQLGASAGEAEQAAAAATALVLAARAAGGTAFSSPPAAALRMVLGPEAGALEDVVASCCGGAASPPRTRRALAVAAASQLLGVAGTASPGPELAAHALGALHQQAALSSEGLEALGAALSEGMATHASGARVLLVMEKGVDATLLQARLLTEGLQVLVAESAAAAQESLARGAEALVVSTGVPGVDALSLTRQVRARSALPVFLVTPREDAGAFAAGLDAGADDVVSRGLPVEVLATKLRRALAHRGAARGRSAQG